MKFKSKPSIIDAEQYVKAGKLVKGMCNSQSCYVSGNVQPHVHTIHNNQIVNLEVGDYVVPEPDGIHYYPIKPDIFEKKYSPMTDDVAESIPLHPAVREVKVGKCLAEMIKADRELYEQILDTSGFAYWMNELINLAKRS